MHRYLFLLLMLFMANCFANTDNQTSEVNSSSQNTVSSTNGSQFGMTDEEIREQDKFFQEAIRDGKEIEDDMAANDIPQKIHHEKSFVNDILPIILGTIFASFMPCLFLYGLITQSRNKNNFRYAKNKNGKKFYSDDDWKRHRETSTSDYQSSSRHRDDDRSYSSSSTNSYSSPSYNTATGLPMASPSVDIGGNSFGSNNNRGSYPY